MPFYSDRLGRIKMSPSTAATQHARELRAQGRDIIALTIGQPDFDTPQHVKRAVNDALVRNETKYPPIDGVPELKEAARRKFQRENALDVKPMTVADARNTTRRFGLDREFRRAYDTPTATGRKQHRSRTRRETDDALRGRRKRHELPLVIMDLPVR